MKGEGNQQDYGMRVYDPRVGRFLSVDPLTSPSWSPYPFAMNRQIDGIDLDGGEWKPYYGENDENHEKILGYDWVGYNKQTGAPNKGSVDGGIVSKRGYTFVYTSDPEQKTGSIDIFSNGAGRMPEGLDRASQHNYSFSLKQGTLGGGLSALVNVSIWNEQGTAVAPTRLQKHRIRWLF